MSLSVKFPADWSKTATKVVQQKTKRGIEKKLRRGFQVLLDYTPVWSGDTIANYRVSIGKVDRTYTPYNQAENPLARGFTGGDREAAEAVSLASMEGAITKLYATAGWPTVFITNNIRYDTGEGIEALEMGHVGRLPYGMFARAQQVMDSTDVSGL